MKAPDKKKWISVVLSVMLILVNLQCGIPSADASDILVNGKLQDGSFENMHAFSKDYVQFEPSPTDPWRTTAETNLIELFRENKSTYVSNVYLTPSDGKYAAELNADEESTLYQIVDTEPSSLYEWGLDHGSRTESETMALIIGPNQVYAPSKNWGEGYETSDLNYPNPTLRTGYKYGMDQMMQMVAWLKAIGKIGSTKNNNGLANGGEAIIVYSKKFAAHGGFEDNQDNQPFSLEPSSVYTERWYIWVMTDHNTTEAGATNPWGHYGSNAEKENSESSGIDLSKYYLYPVPSGQSKTIFAFTSVDNSVPPNKTFEDPTYGNFLDNINFKLYRSLSASTTAHGSAVIGSSDGTAEGSGEKNGYAVSVDNHLATFIEDGNTLKVQAKILEEERTEVVFADIYYTEQNLDGNGSSTSFVSARETERWEVSTDDAGNLVYSCILDQINSAVNLHFVFIKKPLLTYDANGGKPYICTPGGEGSEEENVYSFVPMIGEEEVTYVQPFTSHAPEGQNDGWKFMGWKLFDDNGEGGLLPDVHTIACNYQKNSAETQNFVILKEGVFSGSEDTENGIHWKTTGEPVYDGQATGLTLIAQWRWCQTFVPQTDAGNGYLDSELGGIVEITSAADKTEEESSEGVKRYYADASELISVEAYPEDGFYFAGWFDESDRLVSTCPELTYVETKESVNTYYARFAKKFEQRFARQIRTDGTWENLSDEDASVPLLDHTILHESKGTVVSSTASNNADYALKGWYDAQGNRVDDSMLCNGGKTIRYPVDGDAVYYARFEKASVVQFAMQFVDPDGNITDLSASNVYGQLSTTVVTGISGESVSAKIYPSQGYQLIGWFDGPGKDAEQVEETDPSDVRVITPTITEHDNMVYYARLTARTDTVYRVQHYFQNWNNKTDGSFTLVDDLKYFGTTGAEVTPTVTPNLSKPGREGYACITEIKPGRIAANGGLIFRLEYTRTETVLRYDANEPEGCSAEGSIADTAGYAGFAVEVAENTYNINGYLFNGWNTEPDGSGTAYLQGDAYLLKAGEEGSNPNVLFAQWVPDDATQYKVQHIKLDKNGEEKTTPEETVYYGVTGTEVHAVKKVYEGYVLDEERSSATKSGTVKGDGSLTLKLFYVPQETILTYMPNGGTGEAVSSAGVVDEKLKVANGADLFSRPGYTFIGWQTLDNVSYRPGDDYLLTAGEDILLAQWAANTDTVYKVYHYKVSSDGMSRILVTSEEKTGKTGTPVTAEPIAVPGYELKGDFSLNGMSSNPTGIIAGDGSLILTLHYVPAAAKLIYHANGGDGADISISGRGGETVTVADNTFTRQGYSFICWSTADGTIYAPKGSLTFDREEIILYAQWEANKDTPYCVQHYKLNRNGENPKLEKEERKKGTTNDTAEAIPLELCGYTLDAQNESAVKSGVIQADGSLVLKLYYVPNAATLTYKANGGTGEDITENGFVDEMLTVQPGTAFTKSDYQFVGWNTAADGTGESYKPGDRYTLKGDENVLYAQWESKLLPPADNPPSDNPPSDNPPSEPTEPITPAAPETPERPPLIYDGNGGTAGSNGQTTIDGAAGGENTAGENPFEKDGYEFIGWNTKPDGTGKFYPAGSEIPLEDVVEVLYAQWVRVDNPDVALGNREDFDSEKTNDTHIPKTGDDSQSAGWIVLMIAAGIGLLLLAFGKRRIK